MKGKEDIININESLEMLKTGKIKMKNQKINIIKICVIVIAICVLGSFLMSAYYNMKYTIRNHDTRKSVCDGKGLVYLKSLQTSNEIIDCCAIEEGVLVDCWEFVK